MARFRTGNVVMLPHGTIVIITGHRRSYDNTYDLTDWVPISSSNCSGCTRDDTHEIDEMCWDCHINDGGEVDEDCETCKGTGHYKKTVEGMDRATFLGDNVKAYILERLTKNFEF